jgi:glycosyltransferase involved in cell wall biosynthesis
MVFTASMDAFSNQDGVEYFVKSIFPKIKQSLPSVSFTAVGRNPSKNIYKLAEGHPEIKITGTVEDVRPFIAESSLYIVPLRVGGGSRLKILEAMAMGKAVISTTMGVEGLETTPKKNVIIVDKSEDFAQKAIELLNNWELCQSLGSEGRKLIEEKYSWDKIAGKLGEVWEKAIKQKKV